MSECDNKSAGVIITNSEREVLLIERAKAPFGWAPPAGHVDEHGDFVKTAVEEAFEETGLILTANALIKVIHQLRVERRCRRGGEYHIWDVYMTGEYSGHLKPSPDETLDAQWVSPSDLQAMADETRTDLYGSDPVSSRMLEPTWLDFFVQLDFVE